MFYTDLAIVILAKMKHNIRRHSAVLKGDVQTFGNQELLENFIFSLLIRTCCHTLNLTLATRTLRRFILFHMARNPESVTHSGAIHVVE